MKNLLNPKWIFIINTLPLAILFFIFYGEFQIIKTLLNPESTQLWKSFGISLAFLALINFLYGLYLILNKKKVSRIYGFLALICYISFIYLYGYHSHKIIPFSIPQWMFPRRIELYVGTFIMPTLAYSLFVLVASFTSETKKNKAWVSFLISISIPIIWYLFSQIILPLWKLVGSDFSIHALLIFIIIGTLIFLFFLVRTLLILATKKSEAWKKYELFLKIPVALIFPIIGLLINNGLLFDKIGLNLSGVFGNFNNYWFYILAILNGLFICLPNLNNKLYRLFLFLGRCITFTYTFYFFIVFLPFLPLSIIAIMAIGIGFLMLSPLLLFVVHVNQLAKDFTFLKQHFSKKIIRTFSIIGFLILPLFITVSYLNDRETLNESLEYIYSPDYSKEYQINKESLHKTLSIVKSHKNNRRGGFSYTQQPYLSFYYNWLVLDNLTLSNSKIDKIENIFFGYKPTTKLRSNNSRNQDVEITNIATNSIYNESEKTWKSWIDLEITNNNKNSGFSEYATTIELPGGSWISDYYLYVGDKKEMGILAEKKTAMWVFSNIRNENRDPGILYYLTGNKVAFNVFPFAKNEVRKTGIQLIHKEPIQFQIDEKVVKLGVSKNVEEKVFENKNVVFLSPKDKQKLNKIKRKPYFHFIVDASSKETLESYKTRLKAFVDDERSLIENAKISFVDTYVTTTSFDNSFQQKIQDNKFNGGFYLERAIKSVLFNSYKTKTTSYPVIVVVTNNIKEAIIKKDFLDWNFTFPESNLFYNLNEKGVLETHSLISNPSKALKKEINLSPKKTVLEYKMEDNSLRYLSDNNKPSIILKSDVFKVDETEINKKSWNSGLIMQAKWRSQILHPENSDKEWLDLVRNSFISNIMTPVTSFLVVENEAQKAILKRKQKQVLASNQLLDLGEEAERMSEPSFIIMIVLLGFLIWFRNKKNRIHQF